MLCSGACRQATATFSLQIAIHQRLGFSRHAGAGKSHAFPTSIEALVSAFMRAGPRPLPPPPDLWRSGSSSDSSPRPQALPPSFSPSPSLQSPPTPPSRANTSQAPPPAASRPSPALLPPGPAAAGVPPAARLPPRPPQASPPLSPADRNIDSVKLPPGSFIAEEVYPPSGMRAQLAPIQHASISHASPRLLR